MEAGGAPPEPKQLTCDRPFGYAVLHLPTLTLLFVGVVADPTRVTGAARGLYWSALTGATAAETALVPELDRRESLPWGVAAGSLVLAGKGLHERSDAWLVGKLAGWGVRRPRLWLAGATVASVVALGWVERRINRAGRAFDDAPWDEMGEVGDLPEDVRAIIGALLDAVDGYDSDRLQAQLATARAGSVGDPQAIGLSIDEDAPTTLLDSFLWPVVATFERDGKTHEVLLEIAEGRLWRLSQYVDDETVDPMTHDWSWPAVEELTITPGSPVW